MALGGVALGLVLLTFAGAIWRISAQSGLIATPEQPTAGAEVPLQPDAGPRVAPEVAASSDDQAGAPGAPAFDPQWLRPPVAKLARFIRRVETGPSALCARLKELGLPDAPVTPGPTPESPGWYCYAYQGVGEGGSSFIVTLRGERPGTVDIVRMKLNVLKPSADAALTREAIEVLQGLHATLGWAPPPVVLRAIAAKTNLRFDESGVRYELLREAGTEVRLNLLMTFVDDGAIPNPSRFRPAPLWR